MSTTTASLTSASRAHASGSAEDVVAAITAALRDGLAGQPAAVVLFFASATYDATDLAGPLAAHFPEAAVMGCSTAGEFTDTTASTGGVSAIALPTSIIASATASLVDLSTGPAQAVATAVRALEAGWRRPDP